MGGESMDHLMFWLRHYKRNGNWMWLGMCKGCGKQFQGTGLARFIAHFQRKKHGTAGHGAKGKGAAACPMLPRASDSAEAKEKLEQIRECEETLRVARQETDGQKAKTMLEVKMPQNPRSWRGFGCQQNAAAQLRDISRRRRASRQGQSATVGLARYFIREAHRRTAQAP